MRFCRCIFLLILYVLPSLAFATKRLAVLEFQGVGIDNQRLLILTDYVRHGVLKGIGKEKVDG